MIILQPSSADENLVTTNVQHAKKKMCSAYHVTKNRVKHQWKSGLTFLFGVCRRWKKDNTKESQIATRTHTAKKKNMMNSSPLQCDFYLIYSGCILVWIYCRNASIANKNAIEGRRWILNTNINGWMKRLITKSCVLLNTHYVFIIYASILRGGRGGGGGVGGGEGVKSDGVYTDVKCA